jgi:predicted enzyme involved in methoxymalonyl-ACP biosynthesis
MKVENVTSCRDRCIHNAVLQLNVKYQKTHFTTIAHVGQLLTDNNETSQFFLTCKRCVENFVMHFCHSKRHRIS